MKEFYKDIERISGYLEEKQADFDAAMRISMSIVRQAGQAITYLHNNDMRSAARETASMKKSVKKLMAMDALFRYNTQQAYQEYSEAIIFASIKSGSGVPSVKSLNVDNEAYLLGLLDVVGELKREVLECLREGRLDDAVRYFDTMKEIYDGTRKLRFAEAVLRGFRKKQDTARIQIENAGSEILMFKSGRQP